MFDKKCFFQKWDLGKLEGGQKYDVMKCFIVPPKNVWGKDQMRTAKKRYCKIFLAGYGMKQWE